MGRAERVIGALGALGEARQAPALAQGPDAVAPSGENLMWIGLMADIPDQAVGGRVENMVDGHRQLDHAQTRAQMTARHRNGINGLGTQLRRYLFQLALREFAQVVRR